MGKKHALALPRQSDTPGKMLQGKLLCKKLQGKPLGKMSSNPLGKMLQGKLLGKMLQGKLLGKKLPQQN